MEWELKTVLPVYRLIESGEKTYDTRAVDPEKGLYDAAIGDSALVVPVDEETFEPLDLPSLRYEISDVKCFIPKDDGWEACVKRMLETIGIGKVFPGCSMDEALDMYRKWPSTPRIGKYGIVALGLSLPGYQDSGSSV